MTNCICNECEKRRGCYGNGNGYGTVRTRKRRRI
jgi:hypothetical protein